MRRRTARASAYAVALLLTLALCAACGSSGQQAAEQARPSAKAVTLPPPPKPLPSPSKYVDDGKNGSLVPDNLDISVGATPVPNARTEGPVHGADVSWPQCPRGMGIPQKQGHGAPMPTGAAKFVILGLTNGPSFTPNPPRRGSSSPPCD